MFNKKDYYKEYYLTNKRTIQERAKKYYEDNKEKVDKHNKEYRIKNRDKVLKQDKDTTRLYRASNTEAYILSKAKSRAKTNNIVFNLELSDILIPKYCPYLNTELTYIVGKGHQRTNPSLDRIDPTKGYVKENVQIVSFLANVMKQNATEEQLIAFAKGVLKLHAGINVDKVITELSELQQVSGLRKD